MNKKRLTHFSKDPGSCGSFRSTVCGRTVNSDGIDNLDFTCQRCRKRMDETGVLPGEMAKKQRDQRGE